MKIGFNKIYLLGILTLALFACEKDEDKVIVRQGSAPALTSTANTVVLAQDQADQEAISFSWTASDYGYNAAVKYILQLAKKGNNFATPINVDLGSNLTKKYTAAEFNNLLSQLEAVPGEANEIEARIKSEVSQYVTPAYSNVTAIAATPWLENPPFDFLYMVGDATEFDWDNTKAPLMFRSTEDPFLFTYTGFLEAKALKFLAELGKWAPQYGNDGSGGVSFRETESDPDPGTFNVAADGYYTVNLNLQKLTYSIEPYNIAGKPTFNSIGIIGPFTNWANIVPMTKTAENPHIWNMTYTFAEDTEAKFRIDSSWDSNWGPKAELERFYGKGEQGGENLKVKAGTYKISFNDLTGEYILKKM
ncbi:SusF/SusE family outer membrane protein [Rhodocytophaga rosea]|uniref:SusF/SusE family outer membrane protein n=1 Tax=Rhodocytophaga rosea TaxID=2704465 RepID=A0A6C0GKR0_9BACT|nr:SusE domain-containing protein [Rhodocytophaga rosea]QHT68671.1 SusF/SusE family outer membrane protein [Rhodocytophaga rosea]